MNGALRPTLVLALAGLVAALSLSCNGDGGKKTELIVIDQNILHGLLDEDSAAEPFDRFPERIELIAGALAEQQPAIVMLQEVIPDAYADRPDYVNTRQVLLDALGSEYTALFGDVAGSAINEGFVGQLTLTNLEVLSSENQNISGPRSIHRVTVQTESGPVDIYNTHLEGTGAVVDVTLDASVVEMQAVIDFINETRTGPGPVILAGDFNAEPEDPSIQSLLAAGFIDVLAEGGDATCEQVGDPGCTSGTTPLAEPGNRADHRIDYIFVLGGADVGIDVGEAALFNNEPFTLDDGSVLWASDHIGVRALLELVGE
ncbi:MAG: endonuclease/exonuclease/phosphatase family protein [Dehalococcoidia bacterium]